VNASLINPQSAIRNRYKAGFHSSLTSMADIGYFFRLRYAKGQCDEHTTSN